MLAKWRWKPKLPGNLFVQFRWCVPLSCKFNEQWSKSYEMFLMALAAAAAVVVVFLFIVVVQQLTASDSNESVRRVRRTIDRQLCSDDRNGCQVQSIWWTWGHWWWCCRFCSCCCCCCSLSLLLLLLLLLRLVWSNIEYWAHGIHFLSGTSNRVKLCEKRR